MKKYIFLITVSILVGIILAGCGETISGAGKDISRIGKGIKTIFIRDND